ncbi:MAG: bifunctional precorrin-2 dehydrogenase/sirohydrochlorin ferrochelatase [Deltaproteobacteria bacterium]|nr:bifunctional precorrin-2 dehydrogenase/sirohydrochlorin ferrochelatase [Deltaproteobacteria bacterium]
MDYPIVYDIEGKLCVVIGAGSVGLRKVHGLIAARAKVRLVAPALGSEGPLPEGVEWLRRPYRAGDLRGACLAFAAADDGTVNAAVAAEARRGGIPVNVVDDPAKGDFSLPALLRRGPLTVAVATAGGSPAAAALVRDHLQGVLGPELGLFVALAAALRKRLGAVDHAALCRRLAAVGILDLLAAGDAAGIDRLLAGVGGEGLSLSSLGLDLKGAGERAPAPGKLI